MTSLTGRKSERQNGRLKFYFLYVGYDFQGKMLDLSRDLSAVQCQKDALVR